MHHIRNVIGINSLDNISLLRIYNEITNSNIEKKDDARLEPRWSTVESIFRLLEYEELQNSLQQAKDAKIESTKAFKLAMWSLIITVLFGSIQLLYQCVHDNRENFNDDENHKEIVRLMNYQNNKKDTVIVYMKEFKNNLIHK